MNLFNKLLTIPLMYLLILIPVATVTSVATTGCSSNTQAQVNTAVQDIENWAPVVSSDAASLLTAIAQFNSADAAVLQPIVTQIQNDVAPLQALCAAYLANPSAGVLAQITAAVNAANTSVSSALLAALGIKNANSLAIAKAALAGIATALVVLTTYLAATGQPATITLPKGFALNKGVVTQAMNEAKGQNLLTSETTPEQVINELTKRGIVKFA
jgi:hypothetical protein